MKSTQSATRAAAPRPMTHTTQAPRANSLAQLQAPPAAQRAPSPLTQTAPPAHTIPTRDTTSRENFNLSLTEQKAREVDPTIPSWRQLTPEEAVLYQVVDWVGGMFGGRQRPEAGESGYRATVGDSTYLYGTHASDTPVTAGQMMGPNATQMYSRAIETEGGLSVLNPDGTTSFIAENQHGMAELPVSGSGFGTHNRNDVQRAPGVAEQDQWGTPASIARAINTAADYATLFPESNFSYGDLSTETGGSPLLYANGPRHGTHYNGTQADLQYPTGQGSSAATSGVGEDLFRQQSLINIAESWGANYVHAGTNLNGKLHVGAGTDVHYDTNHDNHFHVGAR